VLDAGAHVTEQVERDLFPAFVLSDLFFRYLADPAAAAEVEAELAAEERTQHAAPTRTPAWLV
jgi:hypothetical protein